MQQILKQICRMRVLLALIVFATGLSRMALDGSVRAAQAEDPGSHDRRANEVNIRVDSLASPSLPRLCFGAEYFRAIIKEGCGSVPVSKFSRNEGKAIRRQKPEADYSKACGSWVLSSEELLKLESAVAEGNGDAAHQLFLHCAELGQQELKLRWLRQTAELGNPMGQYGLAFHLIHVANPPDPTEAKKWFHKVHEFATKMDIDQKLDDDKRCSFIAVVCQLGESIDDLLFSEKRLSRVDKGVEIIASTPSELTPVELKQLDGAVAAGDVHAASRLARYHARVTGDLEQELRWRRRAAELGDVESQMALVELVVRLQEAELIDEAEGWAREVRRDSLKRFICHRLTWVLRVQGELDRLRDGVGGTLPVMSPVQPVAPTTSH